MSDASTTRPFRILYMYRPTNSAIGMVQAMVNVPQDEPGTSRTAPAVSLVESLAQVSGDALFTWNDSLNVIDERPPFHSIRVPAGEGGEGGGAAPAVAGSPGRP